MTKQVLLTQWINAAAEAFNAFIIQSLLLEQEIGSDNLELMDGADVHTLGFLSGASLCLNVEQNQMVEIKILAHESTLVSLTHLMLSAPIHEPIGKDDVSDAIREIVNIISGGVKCRLNAEYDDTIILGLPLYIDEQVLHDDGHGLWGRLNINDIEVLLSVSPLTHALV